MATLLLFCAFGVALSACIPQLPASDSHDDRLAQVQTERAIAILPGVRRAAVTASAAVVTVDATANVSAIAADVARVTGLRPTAIVVQLEPAKTVLLQMGPWIVAEKSRWPLVGTAVAILSFFAIAAGYLAWRVRPRSQR